MADTDDDRFGPRRSDPANSNAARIYDLSLGGDYNYPVDQMALEKVLEFSPEARMIAVHNRRWLQRAVTYLVETWGITQFLDLGSGIPTQGNVHQIAQALNPTARVVYADYDQVAADIAEEELERENNQFAAAIWEDIRQPDAVLNNRITLDTLDFGQPVAIIAAAVFHFVDDGDDPVGIFGRYKEVLTPGSGVALSHLTHGNLTAEEILASERRGVDAYKKHVREPLTPRGLSAISEFFAGTELADPGIVPLPDWHPTEQGYQPDPDDVARRVIIGGVGRVQDSW